MRAKAKKLVPGQWYADIYIGKYGQTSFLKYKGKGEKNNIQFDDQCGLLIYSWDGEPKVIEFFDNYFWYEPTKQDLKLIKQELAKRSAQ